MIGTFVWDMIHGPGTDDPPVESWGGITYGLSGLDAALGDDWEIVPVIKVGADLAAEAEQFLGTLRHGAPDASLLAVAERNNRCELRYYSAAERTERLSGGVPAWTWGELRPALERARLDALYVNFLSGWELDLGTATRLREYFRGTIYCDLHMAAWAVEPSGMRELRPFAEPGAWCRCFDYLQVNEDEMRMLAPDPEAFASLALDNGVRCAMVTLGRRGVQWFTRGATGVIAPDEIREGPGVDPTGCGDVWGATMFARILAGDDLQGALRAANRMAGYNAAFRGATGLAASLARVDYGQTR